MLTIKKDNTGKVSVEKIFTKEELSAYNLYSITGCSQPKTEIEEPTFIGCYH
ncbi:MAG: hypothetical protein AB9836_02045 [Aminipila sp.]